MMPPRKVPSRPRTLPATEENPEPNALSAVDPIFSNLAGAKNVMNRLNAPEINGPRPDTKVFQP